MKEELLELEEKAHRELERITDLKGLESFRIQYLGKKGLLSSLVRKMGQLPPERRPEAGKLANRVKQDLTRAFEKTREGLQSDQGRQTFFLDLTLPGREPLRGHMHPISQVLGQMCDILMKMGFRVAEGPNVELDYYNFEALNIPKEHPARDMQDTFYVTDNVVLRTHTSPIQVRVMEKQPPPVRIIAPGKAYRCDSDMTHTPMFHQVEGLVVDTDVSFADLKGVLTIFVHQMFGPEVDLRFRPSFFPFTEPSAEVDIQCVICGGGGCRVCSETGWLEILGSGMVDPEVFKMVGYDPEEVTGYAFGMGIERIAMLKYGINDLRLFFDNDLRFLEQF